MLLLIAGCIQHQKQREKRPPRQHRVTVCFWVLLPYLSYTRYHPDLTFSFLSHYSDMSWNRSSIRLDIYYSCERSSQCWLAFHCRTFFRPLDASPAPEVPQSTIYSPIRNLALASSLSYLIVLCISLHLFKWRPRHRSNNLYLGILYILTHTDCTSETHKTLIHVHRSLPSKSLLNYHYQLKSESRIVCSTRRFRIS